VGEGAHTADHRPIQVLWVYGIHTVYLPGGVAGHELQHTGSYFYVGGRGRIFRVGEIDRSHKKLFYIRGLELHAAGFTFMQGAGIPDNEVGH
jgi:hypothetical protein